MGIFSHILDRKPKLNRFAIAAIIPTLVSELLLIREQFVYGTITTLKSEKAPVAGINPILETGSDLDAILKAYQLTCIVGFAWDYMDYEDQIPFENQLITALDANDINIIHHYHERYLDCQGNINLLSSSLADDIHRCWGHPEPAVRFKGALCNMAITLGIISQATTASVIGDKNAEKKLKRKLSI